MTSCAPTGIITDAHDLTHIF